MKRMFAPILALTVLACQPAAVRAATDFPTKPISLVVPGPAGGAIDNVARVIAEAMAANLGQSVLMLNADGAGGTLATSRKSLLLFCRNPAIIRATRRIASGV